jgi:DNA-binding transcriptional regulator YiaG
MSQGEFADLVETKRANVGIWECEYKNIHPEYGRFLHLKMLAEQKGLDFNKLIQDEEYCVDDYKRFIRGDIPKKIRNIRAACGCFMGDFGRLMGFDNAASAISQWEAGNTKPSRKYFYKLRELAVSVGIDMDKLNEDPDFYKDEYAEFIETDCGDKIRYIRLQYGVFMEQFAEMIGTSGNTISEWEAGNCVPMRYWFPEIKKAAANKGIDLNALNGHPEIYKDPFTELIQKQDSEEWVRRIRKQCGLTVDAFARYIGVSRSTVNSWETHQNCRKPSRESFNRIVEMAKMRGVDIYDPWRTETLVDSAASEREE